MPRRVWASASPSSARIKIVSSSCLMEVLLETGCWFDLVKPHPTKKHPTKKKRTPGNKILETGFIALLKAVINIEVLKGPNNHIAYGSFSRPVFQLHVAFAVMIKELVLAKMLNKSLEI